MKQHLTKKAYQKPEVAVTLVEEKDIITASAVGTDYDATPNGWGPLYNNGGQV